MVGVQILIGFDLGLGLQLGLGFGLGFSQVVCCFFLLHERRSELRNEPYNAESGWQPLTVVWRRASSSCSW